MKKLIAGSRVVDAETVSGSCGFCDFSAIVRKGHGECGDSAFVCCDDEKFAAGVFDGVSGEPGAASASSEAAAAALDSAVKAGKADENAVRDAISGANRAVRTGYTTAALALVAKNGSFAVGGVGDSPVYSISRKGEADLELPLGRAVGDGCSILKFLNFRSLVTSVLGHSGEELPIHVRSGRLRAGDLLVLASDGLFDNLFFATKDGYVSDSAGTADLLSLLGNEREPGAITSKLAAAVASRIAGGNREEKGRLLVPKEDDLAIVSLRFK